MAHAYAHLPLNTVHACARSTLVCAHASNHRSGLIGLFLSVGEIWMPHPKPTPSRNTSGCGISRRGCVQLLHSHTWTATATTWPHMELVVATGNPAVDCKSDCFSVTLCKTPCNKGFGGSGYQAQMGRQRELWNSSHLPPSPKRPTYRGSFTSGTGLGVVGLPSFGAA